MSWRISRIVALAVLTASAGAAVAPPARAATIEIIVDAMEFQTPVTHAKIGDTVKWTNKDVVAHTATTTISNFDVSIDPGSAATLVVTKAGTYDYFCRYHPNMTAKLIVIP